MSVGLVTICFGECGYRSPVTNVIHSLLTHTVGVEQFVSRHVSFTEYEASLQFFLESLTAKDSPYTIAHVKGAVGPPNNLNTGLVTPWVLGSMMEDK